MKRMLLIGVLVVSGLSFGRDFEYRERQEQQVVQEVSQESVEMLSRERGLSQENQETYSEFHRELDNMDRGYDKR